MIKIYLLRLLFTTYLTLGGAVLSLHAQKIITPDFDQPERHFISIDNSELIIDLTHFHHKTASLYFSADHPITIMPIKLPHVEVVGSKVLLKPGLKSNFLKLQFKNLPEPGDVWITWSTPISPKSASQGYRAGPIQVTPNSDEDYLIKDVLIGGGCFDVNNVSQIGADAGFGTFSEGLMSIGIEEGIIIASGNATNAHGPNIATDITTDFFEGGDPDLSLLTSGTVYDATGVEFDFTPTTDTVKFRYAFASDEYCEWVNSQFNDVFGFFLSGPGLNGPFTNNAVNIALIPGTNDPVAINSVNPLENTEFYLDNTPAGQSQSVGDPTQCDDDLSMNGVAIDLIEYDGFTVVLEATAIVQACETYHIKLVVGDVGDGIWDSAVFLEANSFLAGLNANISSQVSGGTGNVAYEGCLDGEFIVERLPGGDNSQPLTIFLYIDPASTATSGVDYEPLPATVTIPANINYIVVDINVIADGIAEGAENIIVELDQKCSCSSPFAEIVIEDTPPLEIDGDEIIACLNDFILLEPGFISPGLLYQSPDYQYSWSTGGSGSTYSFNATQSEIITVEVEDDCGQISVDSFEITVLQDPIVNFLDDITYCPGGIIPPIELQVTGADIYTIWYTHNGVLQPAINNVTQGTIEIPFNGAGIYKLSSVTANNLCDFPKNDELVVSINEPNAIENIDSIECGETLGAIDIIPISFLGTPDIEWNDGTTGEFNRNDLSPGSYTYTITDDFGCNYSNSIILSGVSDINVELTVLDSNGCNLIFDTLLASISGGVPPYNIEWSHTGSTDSLLTSVDTGTYQITVTDNVGCITADQITLSFLPVELNIDSISDGNCLTDNYISVSVNSQDTSLTYSWTPGNFTDTFIADVPEDTYTFTVVNSDGCEFQITEDVILDTTPPNVIVTVDDTLDCSTSEVNIFISTDSTNIVIWPQDLKGTIHSPFHASVTNPGTFNITVENPDNLCFTTTEVTVPGEAGLLEADILYEDIDKCDGIYDSCTVIVNGAFPPFNYLWLHNNSTEATITNVPPGTYQVEVTDDRGCVITEQVVLPDHPELTISPDSISHGNCKDPFFFSVNVTPLDFLDSIYWSDGTGGSFEISGTTGGDYSVFIIDTNNCRDTLTTSITPEETIPQVDLTVDGPLNCENSDVVITINPSSGDINAQWPAGVSPGPGGLTGTVTDAGEYTVIIIDSTTFCMDTLQVEVVEYIAPPSPQLGPPDIINCNNSSVTITAENPGTWTGTWNTGKTTDLSLDNSEIISSPGQVTLFLFDSLSRCRDTLSTIVSLDTTSPSGLIEGPGLYTCTDSVLNLVFTPFSQGNYSYQWSTSSGVIYGSPASDSISIGGPGTYQIEVTNEENGCIKIFNWDVMPDQDLPVLTTSPDVVLTCNETSATVFAEYELKNNFDFYWQLPDGGISNDSSLIIDIPGVYEAFITNLTTGCTSVSTLNVDLDTVPPPDPVVQPDTLTCLSTTVDINAPDITNVSIAWMDNNQNLIHNGAVLSVTEPGTYYLSLTSTGNGCTSESSFTIPIDTSSPSLSLAGDQYAYCDERMAIIEATSNATSFLWSTANGNIASDVTKSKIEVSSSGIYTCIVTFSRNGCSVSQDHIIIDPVINFDYTLEPPNCTDTLGDVKITNIESIGPVETFVNGENLSPQTEFEFPAGNSYVISLRDSFGCEHVETVSIDDNIDYLVVSATGGGEIVLGQSAIIAAIFNRDESEIEELYWTPPLYLECPDCPVTTATPLEEMVYWVYVRDINGCIDSARIEFRADDDVDVYIPNAFTPNGDGINDGFTLYSNPLLLEIELLRIFDRWGNNVYEVNDIPPNEEGLGWDGSFKGKVMNPAVFAYTIRVRLINGEIKEYYGHVHLVR